MKRILVGLLIVIFIAGAISAVRTIDDALDRVWSLHLSPDAVYLAVISDKGCHIYEPAKAKKLFYVVKGNEVAFSPDNKKIAVATPKNISIFDMAGKRLQQVKVENRTAVKFSLDGQTLASHTRDNGSLQLWEVNTGKLLWQAKAHDRPDLAVNFSLNGKIIATGGSKKNTDSYEICFWDAKTGKRLQTVSEKRHAYVEQIHFFDNDQKLMSVLSDGKANTIWDISDYKKIVVLAKHPLTKLKGEVTFSPDTSQVFHGLDIYQAKTGKSVFTVSCVGYSGTCFMPKSKTVVVADSLGTVQYWNSKNGKLLTKIEGLKPVEWAKYWNALIIVSILWLILWFAFGSKLETPNDLFMVPMVVLMATVFIVILHASLLGHVFLTISPISFLGYSIILQAVLLVALSIVSKRIKAPMASGISIVVFIISIVASTTVLLAASSSV